MFASVSVSYAVIKHRNVSAMNTKHIVNINYFKNETMQNTAVAFVITAPLYTDYSLQCSLMPINSNSFDFNSMHW